MDGRLIFFFVVFIFFLIFFSKVAVTKSNFFENLRKSDLYFLFVKNEMDFSFIRQFRLKLFCFKSLNIFDKLIKLNFPTVI